MSHFWMVRAGEGSMLASAFEQHNCIGIGWFRAGDLTSLDTPESLRQRIEANYANESAPMRNNSIGQVNKFRNVMAPGDTVVTYDRATREYLVGTITGDYEYRDGVLPEYRNLRTVKWRGRVPKAALRRSSNNSLGAMLTIFEPGEDVRRELEEALATGRTTADDNSASDPEAAEEFAALLQEFSAEYLSQDSGKAHAAAYQSCIEQGRTNVAEVLRLADQGRDITSLVLSKLLPHTNTAPHRENGDWVHVAPAITGDVQGWHEKAGWAVASDWPGKAQLILRLVREVASDAARVTTACAEFSASPLSKGLQSGMITPLLNSLHPQQLAIVNSKVITTMGAVAGQALSSALADYPNANRAVLTFVETNRSSIERHASGDVAALQIFDMFCHWYAAVREGTVTGAADEPTPVLRGRAAIDRVRSDSARRIIESICADGAPRAAALDQLARSIALAHEHASSGWSITLKERLVRLNVGSILAADLRVKGILLVVHEPSIERSARRRVEKYSTGGEFRYVPDAVAYLIPYDEINPALALLRPAHEKFLNLATSKAEQARYRSSHSPGVLAYLRESGFDVPDPDYAVPISSSAATQPITPGTPAVHPRYTAADAAAETLLPEPLLERWAKAIRRKGQAILYGPPGTGKTFLARHLSRMLVSEGIGCTDLVQFHSAYTYEDFMQGLRPKESGGGSIRFEMVDGRFKEFCREAAERRAPSVLIIDEINRANLAQVLGELMYLLEYRDGEIPLAGGQRFRIPPNVLIIGTMNTADRSIALVDHALRRRFAFIEVEPNLDVLSTYHVRRDRDVSGLVSVLKDLNTAIGDRQYSVGISFFMRDKLAEDLEAIWTTEIEPYVEELFIDRRADGDRFRWSSVQGRIQV